jgi:hypothetical protein
MKGTILFSLLLLLNAATCELTAQKTAVTDEGEIVNLYDDGTWEYQNEIDETTESITTNPFPFKKSIEAKFFLKSKVNDSAFYIDTKKWQHAAATNNADAEYEFTLKGGDLYAMAITERISIPLTVLKNAVVTNARAAAPDIRVVHEEFRTVNNQTVLQMEMTGSIDGLEITYFGYFLSTSAGTTQWLVYTGSNLMNEYRKEIETLLNGITVQ